METGQLTEEELTAVKAEQSALLGYQKHAEKRKEDMKDPKKKAEWEVKKAQRRMTTAKTSEERAEAGAGTYKSDAVVAVIIVKLIFIGSSFFNCLLLRHSFPTNPNSSTNLF